MTDEVKMSNSGSSHIVLDHLSRWYGSVIGLNDVSLTLKPGVTGLLGPNGAGKTTMMKLLCGLLKPSSGTITLFGEAPFNNSSLMSSVGYCPEWDAFYREMSGLEFVHFLTRLHGFENKEAEKLAKTALEAVNMTKAMDRPISTYSKGMRQRTKLAQAIAHDPHVLILDEPLSGTDPIGRKTIVDIIKDWASKGKIVLVSSHILHEVEAMTRNILLIHRGKVLAEGNIQQIRELIDQHPHHIVIECKDPRAFASKFTAFEDVTQITLTNTNFVLATNKPDDCYNRIPKLAMEHNVEIEALSCSDNDLSAVFRYLIS